MLNHLRNNFQFYFLLLLWWQLGAQYAMLGSILVVVTMLIFKATDMNDELFMGFWFILILSDNLDFASTAKNIYIVLFSLFFFISGGANLRLTNNFSFYFIPYFFIAVICLLFSDSLWTSAQKTLSYILIFTFVPNYVENLYIKQGPDFFKNLIYFACIVLSIGIIMYFISPLSVFMEGRYRGNFFRNPNGLGIFCFLVFILLYVINEFYPSLFSRNEKYILFGIVLLSLYLTRSRSAIVSVAIFYLFRYIYRFSPVLGFFAFLFTLFIYQYLADNFSVLVISLGLQEYFRIETLDTGSGRTIAWDFAWSEIQNNFYLGKGISYTETLFKKNYTYLSVLGHQGNAHNSYLTIWLDTGLIGLLSYLFGFVFIFIKASKYSLIAIPIMYSILFSIFFESWLTASLNPFTIVLLIIITILASDVIEKTEAPENAESSLLT